MTPARQLCPTCKGEGYVLSTVPHTSATATTGRSESACEDCDIVHECYLCYNDIAPPCVARAAKAERERFIEQIEDRLQRYPSDLGDMYLLSDTQSLRAQQQNNTSSRKE